MPFKIEMQHQSGLSLIEILLVFALLSVMILPFTIVVSQISRNAHDTYVKSSQFLLANRLIDEMNPERPSFVTNFNQSASTNTSISESGQTLPYRRLVDTTTAGASDSLRKTTYLYFYRNASDASSSAIWLPIIEMQSGQYNLRVGNTSDLTDSRNDFWYGDNSLYASAQKTPGYVSNMGTTGSSASNIVNANDTYDDALYQNYREGTGNVNLDYNFDVINGSYTVKLLFCELNSSVNGSAPNRRLMDIYLEGTAVTTSYSPYETTGGTYIANVQTFDIDVSDGTLNISVRRNASSNYDARLSGIIVKKRLME